MDVNDFVNQMKMLVSVEDTPNAETSDIIRKIDLTVKSMDKLKDHIYSLLAELRLKSNTSTDAEAK